MGEERKHQDDKERKGNREGNMEGNRDMREEMQALMDETRKYKRDLEIWKVLARKVGLYSNDVDEEILKKNKRITELEGTVER